MERCDETGVGQDGSKKLRIELICLERARRLVRLIMAKVLQVRV